jgi:release factor glutamine methyltransferase
MVDEAIKEITNNCIYIDVWTWSWAIPVSVYKNSKHKISKAYAVDISEDAIEVAKKNIESHNLIDIIKLLKSDLLSIFELDTSIFNISWNIDIAKLVITANLPYIKNQDFWNMDQEVILHEPSVALYWWEKTWFELYERLIYQCFKLKSIHNIVNLILFIEIWFDQKTIAIKFLEKLELSFEIFKDNWWVDRCIKITF